MPPDMILPLISSLESSLEHISQGAAALFVSSLWQGCLLAGCVAICLRLAPRTSASVRFAIWSATFFVLVGLPVWSFLTNAPIHTFAHTSAPPLSAAQPMGYPPMQLDFRWSVAILALWALASLYRAINLAVHILRLRKLWKRATPVAVEPLALPDGRRGGAQICSTRDLDRPSVIGFLAPRILIPDWLLSSLAPKELEQILLHETGHLQRRDDWTNLLQKLSLVLFPLNPALVWTERRLCAEREIACDEHVVQATHAPRAYATCLTRLAERNLTRRQQALSLGALSLGAWQRRPELVTRVHRILAQRQSLAPAAAWLLASVLVLGVLTGATQLAHAPQMVEFVSPSHPALAAAPPRASVAAAPAPLSVSAHLARRTAGETIALDATPRRIPAQHRIVSPSLPAGDDLPLGFSAVPVLQAEASDENSAPGQAAPARERQWILMTTWQAQETDAVTPGQPSTVKLMLTVYPPSSHTYAAVPTRNGWIVIQL